MILSTLCSKVPVVSDFRLVRACCRRKRQFSSFGNSSKAGNPTWRVSSSPPSSTAAPPSTQSPSYNSFTGLMPQNILILRHGESMGNQDESLYMTTPDWRIPLSERGKRQSREAGQRIQQLIADPTTPVMFYVSPYKRTKETLAELRLPNPILYTREEPRLREQDFGNFQVPKEIQQAKSERPKFGRFFFRFPNGGESGADVFDRVSAFCGTLIRDMEQLGTQDASRATAIFVTHGITSRCFVMKWFHWSVDEFEELHNPPNCGILHLQMTKDGYYQLTEASRRLIKGPLSHWTGVGGALKLGEALLKERRRRDIYHLSAEDRRAFDSLPDSAWGL